MVGVSNTSTDGFSTWQIRGWGATNYPPAPRPKFPWERRFAALLAFLEEARELFGRVYEGWIPGKGWAGILMPAPEPLRPLDRTVDLRFLIRMETTPRRKRSPWIIRHKGSERKNPWIPMQT